MEDEEKKTKNKKQKLKIIKNYIRNKKKYVKYRMKNNE